MVRTYSFVASLLAPDAEFRPETLGLPELFAGAPTNAGTTSSAFCDGGFVMARRPAHAAWLPSKHLGRARATLDVAATLGNTSDLLDVPPYRYRGWLVVAIPTASGAFSATARQALRAWSQKRLSHPLESTSDLELFAVPALAALVEQPNASSPAISPSDVHSTLARALGYLVRTAEEFQTPLPSELILTNGRLLAVWSGQRDVWFSVQTISSKAEGRQASVVITSEKPGQASPCHWCVLTRNETGVFSHQGRLTV
jgi:hypothetical protein